MPTADDMAQMTSDKRAITPDMLAVAVLVATGVVIAWPALRNGYLTYLDNPVHLSEVYAIAFEANNGWSEIAFCGFPIMTLHSPLWYGVLAWLVGVGFPAGPLYAFCLLLGFLAPPLALYFSARRRVPVLPAVILAYLLLIQRPAIVGIGSALGGMWTFYIASAALILLIDRLAWPCRSAADLAWIAGLTGFILLTHLYTIVPLGLLAALHVWLVLERKRVSPKILLYQIGAGIVGIIAAAAYWLPLVMAGRHTVINAQNLPVKQVLARLFVPTHVFDLLDERLPALESSLIPYAIPMVALVGLGLLGTVHLRRRKDDAPLSGVILAASLLILLIVVAPEFDVKFLGPGSWRMLYFVRIGLAVASLPFFAWAASRARWRVKRPLAVGISALAVIAGLWWGIPLASEVPARAGEEMAEVRELWRWMRDNKNDEWGRVYLQDTFDLLRDKIKLDQSHVLALTARETGVRQLGPTYGVAPYRTVSWTPSEFRTLYRKTYLNEENLKYLRTAMWLSNTTHLVVSDPATAKRLLDSTQFEVLHLSGRFRVMRPLQTEPGWAAVLTGGGSVEVPVFEPGRIVIDVRDDYKGGDLLIKTSYHPNWRIEGFTGARLEADDSGLVRVIGLEPGPQRLVLEYGSSTRPRWLSLIGWLGILGLCFLPRINRR
jgi:hypothetical protein